MARNVLIALAVLFAAGPAAAGGHDFRMVFHSRDSVSFADMGEVRPVGDNEFEVGFFRTSASTSLGPSESFVHITRETGKIHVACDWGIAWTVPGSTLTDATGAPTQRLLPDSGPEFLVPEGPYGVIRDLVCAPVGSPPEGRYPSTEAAYKEALTHLPAPGVGPTRPIEVSRRPPSLGFPPAPRYALALREPPTNRAVYVDWANLTREGDVVTFGTLWIAGRPAWEYDETHALRMVKLNCRSREMTFLAEQRWASRPYGQVTMTPQATRPIGDSVVGRALIAAVCRGAEPPTTLGTGPEAVANADAALPPAP